MSAALVAGPVWREADEENECWTAEVQAIGGYYVIATVHGGSEAEARLRQSAVLAALTQQGETTPVSGDEVERVARAIYDATHAGLSNCYSWDDAWEPYQEARRELYYKEARAAIAALHPTDPAAIRNAALEEAARVAEAFQAKAEELSRRDGVTDARVMASLAGEEIAARIRGLVKEVG